MVDDLLSYRTGWSTLDQGVVPVLAPADPARQRRWQHVLDWYGGLEIADGPQTAPMDADGLVVLDPDMAEIARHYAAFFNRPVVAVGGSGDALTSATQNWRTAMVIGRYQDFHIPGVFDLAGSIPVPWAIAPVADLPGLTFLLAKILFGKARPSGGRAVVDVFNNCTDRWADGGAMKHQNLNVDRVGALLEETAHGHLVILAHGRGGHINLGGGVLCGLVGDAERGLSGNLIPGGCGTRTGWRHCKRAKDAAMPVFHAVAIKAQNLHLFTCAGSLVPGEHYPSDISNLMVLAEGHAGTGLVSTGIFRIDNAEPHLAVTLAEAGISIAGIADLLCRLKDNESIAPAPYVAVGDPAGRFLDYGRVDPDGQLAAAETHNVVPVMLDDPTKHHGRVFESPPGYSLLVGRNAAVFLNRDHSAAAPRLNDMRDRFDDAEHVISEYYSRAARCQALEQVITIRWQTALGKRPEAAETLQRTTLLRRDVQYYLQMAAAELEIAGRTGTWQDGLTMTLGALQAGVASWDEAMARFVSQFLYTGRLPVALRHGYRCVETHAGDICPGCGGPAFALRHADPCRQGTDIQGSDCPRCGEIAIGYSGTGGVALQTPQTLTPGDAFSVSYGLTRSDTEIALDLGGGGHIALTVFDSTDDVPQINQVHAVRELTGVLSDVLPADVRPHNQTIHAAWIRDMTISAYRVLRPAIPAERI